MGLFSCGNPKHFEPVTAKAHVGPYNPPGATRKERERVVAAATASLRSNSVSSTSSTNSTSSSVHHKTRSAFPGHAGSGGNMQRQTSIRVSISCSIASGLNSYSRGSLLEVLSNIDRNCQLKVKHRLAMALLMDFVMLHALL